MRGARGVWYEASRDLRGEIMFSKIIEDIICRFITGWLCIKWLYLCAKAELGK